jgi:hypothetical protein
MRCISLSVAALCPNVGLVADGDLVLHAIYEPEKKQH